MTRALAWVRVNGLVDFKEGKASAFVAPSAGTVPYLINKNNKK